MNHMIDTQKLKSQISEKEWQLRLDLAATYINWHVWMG